MEPLITEEIEPPVVTPMGEPSQPNEAPEYKELSLQNLCRVMASWTEFFRAVSKQRFCRGPTRDLRERPFNAPAQMRRRAARMAREAAAAGKKRRRKSSRRNPEPANSSQAGARNVN